MEPGHSPRPGESNEMEAESGVPKRRKSKRIVITSTAAVTPIEEGVEAGGLNGTVINISRGGMGLCTTESLRADGLVNIILKFINLEGRPCEETVQGRVAWQKEIAPFYISGIEFGEWSDQSPSSLLRFLEVKEEEDSTATRSL